MKSYPLAFVLLLSLLVFSCRFASEETPDTPTPTAAPEPSQVKPEFHASHLESRQNTPFSDAVQVGNTFYLSGQIGRDHAAGKLVDGGIEAETRQTLENIKAVLNHHGLEMADVVKAMVVLDDIEDFAAFNTIYTSYFPQRPARTTFAAEALAAGAKIEIEVVAVKSE
jgi:2-iminobutanoate/2-iminopropanoate deaminase